MFTGLVEEVGTVERRFEARGGVRVRVTAHEVVDDLSVGASVAVSGCCLTVVRHDEASFDVELTQESLARTAPRWQEGARVNLERALPATGRFGGHVVAGHVEGVGEVRAVESSGAARVVTVRAPQSMARWLVPKGSITVDGVSLTVVDVGGAGGSSERLLASEFTLWLIPHTLQVTTLGELRAGHRVNLEADLMARYAERAARFREDAGAWEARHGA